MGRISIDWSSFKKKLTPLKGGFPTGLVLFTGSQGSGKSLSQSKYIRELQNKYNAKVFSATDYKYADEIIEESEIAKKILTKREDRPTIFALDEIQVLLDRGNISAQESTEIRKAIYQQRKRNTTIVGTLQVLLDLDIKYRRQIASVVKCSKFGNIQLETWIDGTTLQFDDETLSYQGSTEIIKLWKRNNEVFSLYDTFQVVGQGSSP